MKKIRVLKVAFISLIPLLSFAQQPQSSRCQTEPEYRQFDFWIGEWEVKNAQDNIVGNSIIESILGECVIFENWTGGNGAYTGKSLNYYNVIVGKWQQKWIDNQGVPIEFEGSYDPETKTMRYTGTGLSVDTSLVHYKLTFYHLTDDHVRQQWEQSSDNKETWQTIFDGHYRRKK